MLAQIDVTIADERLPVFRSQNDNSSKKNSLYYAVACLWSHKQMIRRGVLRSPMNGRKEKSSPVGAPRGHYCCGMPAATTQQTHHHHKRFFFRVVAIHHLMRTEGA